VTVFGAKGYISYTVFDITPEDVMDYFFIVYDQDIHQKIIDDDTIKVK
tara:strand:- start:246 stop:389 length:144 start_codon:yes stop_codon:yes gene_type:complete